jgi:hypothetical protein
MAVLRGQVAHHRAFGDVRHVVWRIGGMEEGRVKKVLADGG